MKKDFFWPPDFVSARTSMLSLRIELAIKPDPQDLSELKKIIADMERLTANPDEKKLAEYQACCKKLLAFEAFLKSTRKIADCFEQLHKRL